MTKPKHATTRQWILGQLIESLEKLSMNDLQRVLLFTQSLGHARSPVGVRGKDLLALEDLFSAEDMDDMARFMEAAHDEEDEEAQAQPSQSQSNPVP